MSQWTVPVLSLYMAISIFFSLTVSGPENNFWYTPIALQYLVILVSESYDKWPIFGGSANLIKNLLVIILIVAIPPGVASSVLGISIPTNVYAHWLSITIPLYISLAFTARQDTEGAKLAALAIPVSMLFANWKIYNPLMEIKSAAAGGSP